MTKHKLPNIATVTIAADYARQGDRFASQGNWREAINNYGIAVQTDTGNKETRRDFLAAADRWQTEKFPQQGNGRGMA